MSFAFARKYGARLKALVLADTRAQADSPAGRTARFHLAQTAFNQGGEAVADIMLPKLLGPTSLQTKQDLVRHVREIILAAPVSGIVVDLMAMADRSDAVPFLCAISCPTLVLIGQEDTTTPMVDSQLMAKEIPGARLAVIPSAGHLSNLEQPDVFNDLVKGFVEGVGLSSGGRP